MKKPYNLTRSAASLLLIPLIHLALLAVSGGLAYLLEFPTNRGVFYVFFAAPAMLLFFTLPFVVLLVAHASIGWIQNQKYGDHHRQRGFDYFHHSSAG